MKRIVINLFFAKSKVVILICLLLLSANLKAQFRVKGKIVDSDKTELPAVPVILKDFAKTRIISHTFSDENGVYSFDLDSCGKYVLISSFLGYSRKEIEFTTDSSLKELELNIVLEEKVFELDNVVIQADRPIIVKKDTVNFKTKFFVDGTEQTVEDMLKKFPAYKLTGMEQ